MPNPQFKVTFLALFIKKGVSSCTYVIYLLLYRQFIWKNKQTCLKSTLWLEKYPGYYENAVATVKVKNRMKCRAMCSVVSNSATPWTVAHQALLFMEFPRQEYWSGLPFPSQGGFSE